MALFLSGEPDADALLTEDPLALLIGMVLDQQIPLEKAFRSPFDLRQRLGGTLDAAAVASMDPDALADLFRARPALHRFPRSMSARVQELCARIVDAYGGDAAAVWTSAATGEELLDNVRALPGFGEHKARIFVALLGKQLGVRPPGWEAAAGQFGQTGSFRSVADINSPETLAKVRRYKQDMKARAKADSVEGGLSRPTGPSARWGLADRRLYLCTPDRPDLERFVEACIEGGVDVVQLREKRLRGTQLEKRATLVQRVCADYNVPFVLNDDPALAGSIGADGVHVGQDDMDPAEARRVVGTDAVIGLSTHARDELDRAVGGRPRGARPAPGALPVDYISAGPVAPTPTKPGRPGTGIDYVREAARRAPWTVWVTGGIDPTTVAPLLAAGARHFVVVRWLTEAADPKGNARTLRTVIDETVDSQGG